MKPTEFRVFLMPYAHGEATYVSVKTVREACIALQAMVQIRKYLEDNDYPYWEDDVSGVEMKDSEGDWVDFYDQNGDDFESYYENYVQDENLEDENLEDIGSDL